MNKPRNRIKCANCGDVIESKYRHDWQTCSCKLVFCDGGRDYQRLGFSKPSDIIIVFDDGSEKPFAEFIEKERAQEKGEQLSLFPNI